MSHSYKMVATVDAEILDISFEKQRKKRNVMGGGGQKRLKNLLITLNCTVYTHCSINHEIYLLILLSEFCKWLINTENDKNQIHFNLNSLLYNIKLQK